MFSAFFGRRAGNDLADYRADYPSKREDPRANGNLLFYQGTGAAQPGSRKLAQMHAWFGNYEHLEWDHSYIQWLFPIQEHGMNSQAQPLMKHERAAMRADPAAMANFVRSYKMMLDFYGMELADDATGAVQRRAEGFQPRYLNLNTSSHNYLRITRILKCLGELGLEHYKAGWLDFLFSEIFVARALPACASSYRDYWSQTLYDDGARAALQQRLERGGARGSGRAGAADDDD